MVLPNAMVVVRDGAEFDRQEHEPKGLPRLRASSSADLTTNAGYRPNYVNGTNHLFVHKQA
jgi:hypothetical protein